MKLLTSVFCMALVLLTAHAHNNNTEDGSDADFSVTIPPECVGEELCLTKPVDYPSAIIDKVAQQLLRRFKRQINDIEPIEVIDSDDNNNCAISRKIIQPFMVIRNLTQHVVIQSRFFSQTMESISCKKAGAKCFEDFILPDVNPSCRTKYSSIFLSVFDLKEAKVKTVEAFFPIDCECTLYSDY